MSIQSAARRLSIAVRDERKHRGTTDEGMRAALEDELNLALIAVENALTPGWDGSEPCRGCGGRGAYRESHESAPNTVTPCGLCAGTGRKGVYIHGVAA